MGDVTGAQGAASSAAGEFELTWLEAGREVRGRSGSASAVAFEEVRPGKLDLLRKRMLLP